MGSAHYLLIAFRGVYRGNSLLSKFRITVVTASIYHIWDMRNRKLFDDEVVDPDAILRKIKIMVFRNCDYAGQEFRGEI